jgi:hypothetical protein
LYSDKVRFVFHFQISDEDLERALDVVLGRA